MKLPAFRIHLLVVATLAAVQSPVAGQERRLGLFEREIAELGEPVAAAIDGELRIYIAESAANRVSVFERSGKLLKRFGEFGTGPGQMIAPAGIAVGPGGELFVSDSGNHRVQVFDRDGAALRAWGTRGTQPGQFNQPAGIVVSDQNVFVSDCGNARVQAFDLAGRFVRSIGSFGSASGELSRPLGIALSREKQLFVADADNNRIEVFTAEGAPVRRWGEFGSVTGMLNDPTSVALAAARVFVCDRVNHRIQVFAADGKPVYQWGVHAVRPREGKGSLHYPAHIAIAPAEAFAVVCEPLEDRVQIFGPRPAGDGGSPPLIPPGDAVGSHFGMRCAFGGGLLAVTEQDGRGIILYEMRGREPIEIHRFGSFGAGNGKFRRPDGVALSADGSRLIVSDLGQRRLQIFRLDRSESREIRYLPFMSRLARTIEFDALEQALPENLRTGHFEVTTLRLDRAGNYYLLDAHNGRVLAFSAEFAFRFALTDSDGQPFSFRRPSDLVLNGDETRLLVADAAAREIVAFDRNGRVDPAVKFTPADTAPWSEPFGLAVGQDGRVFVSDAFADRVLAFQPSGAFLGAWGSAGLGRVQFHRPRGLAIDDVGCLVVMDHGNHRGQLLTLEGEYVDSFGSRFFVQPAKRGPPPTAQRKPSTSRPTSTAPVSPFAGRQPASRPAQPPWTHAIVSNDGSYLVEFRARPEAIPMNELFAIDVRISSATPGAAMPGEIGLTVDADMPEHLHGMNTQPKVVRNDDGTFTARGMQLHMSGYWEIYFDISAGGMSERAQFGVTLE